MGDTKITPLPWGVGQSATKIAICEDAVIGSDRMEHPVCVVSPLDKLDARDMANAEYIVKACNAYPDHIAAFRLLHDALIPPRHGSSPQYWTAHEALVKCLRASGEEL